MGDIVDRDFQKKLVDEAIQKFGKIDILVTNTLSYILSYTLSYILFIFFKINNAGSYKFGSIFDLTEENFDEMMNVNYKTVVFLTQLCVPHLIASKGVIVNNASISAIKCIQNIIGYGPVKAALNQFSRCCALGNLK